MSNNIEIPYDAEGHIDWNAIHETVRKNDELYQNNLQKFYSVSNEENIVDIPYESNFDYLTIIIIIIIIGLLGAVSYYIYNFVFTKESKILSNRRSIQQNCITTDNLTVNNKNEDLGMDWFNSYLSVMKFFIILYVVSIISTLINNAITDNSSFTIILLLLDAMYVWFQIKVYAGLKLQLPDSVHYLLIILIINWFTKPIIASANSEDITYGVFLWIYAIWYIPNIIYFYKRIDVFKE